MFQDKFKNAVSWILRNKKSSSRPSKAMVSVNDVKIPSQQLPILPHSSVGPLPVLSTKEKSDDYCKVIVKISDEWRVVESKEGNQWIIQRRRGTYKDKPAWKSVCFCRSRKGLRYWVRIKTKVRSLIVANKFRKLPLWIEK